MIDARSIVLEHSTLPEQLHEISQDLNSSDRLHFMNAALEAISNDGSRGKLVQKLYAEVLKSGNLSYGEIDASKGNLAGYKYYPNLMDMYDLLTRLQLKESSSALVLYKDLHDMMIERRADFELGYKFNIDYLKVTYSSLVMSLHRLIDIATVQTTDYLRDVVNMQLETARKPKNDVGAFTMANIERFLSAYKKGEWESMMRGFRKDKHSLIGVINSVPATVIAAILGILLASRAVVAVYYFGKTKISEYAKSNAEILKKQIELDNDKASSASEKNREMLDFLEGKCPIIANRIAKDEEAAKKAIADSNRKNMTPAALAFDTLDDDFELL